MTQYEVTERQLPEYGKVFAEHPKFGHYKTIVEWVCLVTGPNQSKYFALCNLRELFITRMEFTCAEPPPIQGCELPPPMCIFPMPDMYPQAVWLGIANGILELAKREVEIRIAVAESELEAAA